MSMVRVLSKNSVFYNVHRIAAQFSNSRETRDKEKNILTGIKKFSMIETGTSLCVWSNHLLYVVRTSTPAFTRPKFVDFVKAFCKDFARHPDYESRWKVCVSSLALQFSSKNVLKTIKNTQVHNFWKSKTKMKYTKRPFHWDVWIPNGSVKTLTTFEAALK